MQATPIIVAMIMAVGAFLGVLVTYLSTRGKTKTDARAALDKRIDERLDAQLKEAWSRLDSQDKKIESQDAQIDDLKAQNRAQGKLISVLQAHAEVAEKREVMMYQHTRALRNHILNELPPPPPVMPKALQHWFEQFDTAPE